jgi:NADPH:quinone reductase-like Zn-dependent oxidoreductase
LAVVTIAIAFDAPGPPEVLHAMEIAPPEPGPGEVRLRVRAAGVQPADTMVRRTGWTPPGATLALPQIPGNELAGVVDALGPGVTRFAVGDEVLGYRVLGSYAELAAVPADQLVAKPAAMPWEVAGGFSAGAQTASMTLEQLGVRAGETLLVHGAAGSVGTVATQLGRRLGASVIGTASEPNHDYLRALGAVPVRYGDGLVERVRALAPGGVDVVLDTAGRGAVEASLELGVAPDRIATIADHAKTGPLGLRAIRPDRSAERLRGLVALWSAGELRIEIRRAFPLRDAAAAHRLVESGHGRGKVVLVV